MSRPGSLRSRQILLFVAAIVVPCGLLVVLTIRMLIQDGELADKRAMDERRRLAADVRQELLTRADRIASRVAPNAALEDGVALAARVAGDRLLLPWENGQVLAAAASLDDGR